MNKTYRAIIAIDKPYRNGHLLEWIGDVPYSVKDAEENYNVLSETEFNHPPGIYVARMEPYEFGDYDWEIETNVSDRITWKELM